MNRLARRSSLDIVNLYNFCLGLSCFGLEFPRLEVKLEVSYFNFNFEVTLSSLIAGASPFLRSVVVIIEVKVEV